MLQRIVNPVYAVVFHRQEEAGRHLGLWRPGIKQGGGGMGKVFFGHQLIGLYSRFQVAQVDPHCHPHKHMLGPFGYLAV